MADDPKLIKYLYTDDLTGEETWVTVPVKYVEAVKLLRYGRNNPTTQHEALLDMGEADSDSNRRKWRAACEYVLFHDSDGLFPCSTSSGFFLAKTRDEVEACLANKEKAATALLDRIAKMRGKATLKFGP